MAFDSEGYLWLGTGNGLFRYNGSSVKHYTEDNGAGLRNSFVSSILPDKDGCIWIGTGKGIQRLDHGRIIPEDARYMDSVYQLAEMDAGRVLFSGTKGLYLHDKAEGTDTPAFVNEEAAYSEIIRVFGNRIWVSTTGETQKILVLDRSFNVIKEIVFGTGGRITDIVHQNNMVLVSSSWGIAAYSEDGTPLPVKDHLKRICQGKEVCVLTYDHKKNRFIVGIQNEGFYLWNAETDSPEKIWDEEPLTTTGRCQYTFSDNRLFLSKNGGYFETLSLDEERRSTEIPDLKTGEIILSFLNPANSGKETLFATNQGLYSFNINSETSKKIPLEGLEKGHQLSFVTYDSKGELWVKDDAGRILHMKPSGEGYVLTDSFPTDATFTTIWEWKDGRICWLEEDKLQWVNPASGIRDSLALPGEIGPFYSKGADGRFFFYGYYGVFSMEEWGIFQKFDIGKIIPSSCYPDAYGNLWVGDVNSGLYKYNIRTGETLHLGSEDGLPGDVVRGIVGDYYNEIWVSTRNAIARISLSTDQITAIKGQKERGLLYYMGCEAAMDTPAGKKYLFGCGKTIDILTSYTKTEFKDPGLTLDDVTVSGKSVDVSGGSLTLSHDQNWLTLYFSGMDFSGTAFLNYSYKLDGFDRDWSTPTKNVSASYSRIPRGRYTFRVRVQTPDGKWSPEEATLRIRKRPSFWDSVPMLCLYAGLFLLLVAIGFRQYRNSREMKFKSSVAKIEKTLSEKNYREKMAFFTNISHEYRTPLSLIYGPAKELERSAGIDQKSRRLVRLISENAARMMHLTEQVMNFNRLDSRLETLQVRPADVGTTILSVTDNFGYLLEEKQQRLHINIEEGLRAFMDTDKIEKILTNLLSNAIKYTPKGGHISLEAEMLSPRHVSELYGELPGGYDGEYAEIILSDDGIGIPEDQRKKIFERFHRLKEEVERGTIPEGFGIGLHYAMCLIHIHKGLMKVTPNTTAGSRFSFIFPAGKEAYGETEIWDGTPSNASLPIPGTDPATAENGEKPGPKKGLILIVEDNQDVRQYIASLLGETYRVRRAANGVEGWEALQEELPDAIVSDVMMPYKDGLTFCREVKEDDVYGSVPFILLTAKAEAEDKLNGLSCGADGYIPKPFDPEELRLTLSNLLSRKEKLQKRLLEQLSLGSQAEEEDQNALSPSEAAFMERLYKLMDENLDKETYSIKAMAEGMNMGYSSFYNKVKALVGVTPQNLLTAYRLNKAMELLKEGTLNVSEVSYRVGFATLQGFSKSFKNKFGINPSSV